MEQKTGSPSGSSGTDSVRTGFAESRKRFLHVRKMSASQLGFVDPGISRTFRLQAMMAEAKDDSDEWPSLQKQAAIPTNNMFHRSSSMQMLSGGSLCTCGQQIALNAKWLDELVKLRAEKESIEKEWSSL